MPDSTYDANMAAASQLAVAAVNSTASATMNRNTRKWNENQYRVQRENALSDWNMQNEYNSPQAQMERLRKAGLNPNLVYGNGATAQSESMPRQTDIKPWTPHAPQIDANAVGSMVQQMYDVKIKEATYDNLRAQNTVIAQEAFLREAQTRATLANAGLGEFDLGFKQDSRIMDLQAKELNLSKTQNEVRKLDADTAYTIASMNKLLTQQDLTTSMLETELVKAGLENNKIEETIQILKKEGTLKDWEIKLSKMGVSSRDGLLYRILMAATDALK